MAEEGTSDLVAPGTRRLRSVFRRTRRHAFRQSHTLGARLWLPAAVLGWALLVAPRPVSVNLSTFTPFTPGATNPPAQSAPAPEEGAVAMLRQLPLGGVAVAQAATLPPAAPQPLPYKSLPQWVQTKGVTTFWSGPTDQGVVKFNSLPAWTFLKVLGAQHGRLQVMYDGDGANRKAGIGWVDAMSVQPSDPSGTWLRNFRVTKLSAGDNPGGPALAPLDQWMPMRLLDQRPDFVKVRVYTTDFSKVVAEGWVSAGDVGPTGPPTRAVSTDKTLPDPQPAYKSKDAFIAAVGQAARESHAKTGVPASVTVAQAILESDWGDSLLTRVANNYFGIKAMGELGSDGAVWMKTMEYDDAGNAYYTMDPFRAYTSLSDSIADHDTLFRSLSRYAPAMKAAGDPDEFARKVWAGGYSTDPSYPDKLIGLMEKYNLYQFDS